MGKGNRHKKNLKSERSKVKLKTKTLPKGTNVTNTTFKIRKIVIGEQLKNVGENKVDITIQIKDCLSKLRHHNHKACMGSLQNLKSILNKSPSNMIENQFGSILKNLAHLTTNEERDVRRESFTVLLVLLEPIAEENAAILIPYYDMLASYLCCAMTHIDPRIQNDSLLFLDVLLKVVPSIILDNYSKILDNFLDMISKLRTEAKPERTLTLNLSTKLTTIKWRVKVLQRLQCMFQQLINMKKSDESVIKGTPVSNSSRSSQKVYIFNDQRPIYLGLRDYYNLKNSDLGLFSGSIHDFSSSMNKENILENKTLTLMPLLYETWLEIKLNNSKDSYNCYILDADSASLLMSILEIMISLEYLIREHGNEKKIAFDWFFKKYANDFSRYIVDGFPYSEVSTNRKSNTCDTRNSIDCLQQNLYICKMFLLFNTDFKLKCKVQYELILKYIEGNFLQICHVSNYTGELHNIIEDLLHNLFFQVAPKWCKSGLSLDSILELFVELVETNLSTNLRKTIFKLLCDISQDRKLKHFYDNATYLEWLQGLPSKLCTSKITIDEIPYLCTLARHNNSTFLQNMLLEFPNILDILTRVPDRKFISSIIGILYYVPGLTSNNIDLIKDAIDNSDLPTEDKSYLKTILNKK